jgi:hypothetical protein
VVRAYTGHLRNLFVDDTAIEHPYDPIGGAADGDVVGHDHEREPPFDVERAHERDDFGCLLAVEVTRRFVGPHDGGLVDEGTSDGYPLALTTRQLLGDVVGTCFEADIANASRARRRADFDGTPDTSSGSSTFSAAVRTGIRL